MKKECSKPVYVTEPYLPPLEDFTPYLEKIWESKWLTNNGSMHQQLERELCEYLGVEHLSLFTNGTIALVSALQSLGIKGEVITTPYSFAATSHSLIWNNLKPVFVDIDPVTMNIDPNKIESAITAKTSAILAVHCYGRPCDVDCIQRIAGTHGLSVIYDAAHCFGVKYRGESLLKYGDLSVLSFHTTKVFNTLEGGAIVCPNAETKLYIDQLKNFGIVDEANVGAVGINGKMNEVQAAFGLMQLKHIDDLIQLRKDVDRRYRAALRDISGINCLMEPAEVVSNYSYFPVLVTPDFSITRDALYQKLKDEGIYARRYFFPLISDMPNYKTLPSAHRDNLPMAAIAAQQVLCLPFYPNLSNEQILEITNLIRQQKGAC
jgi:dTDP-4-amino-4,6-dideoxygalactose transaminase